MTQHGQTGRLTIAIDGPAGAGKSTVARAVAQRLGYLYIDTGAMYRALTLKALRHGLAGEDTAGLGALAAATVISLEQRPDGVRVLLDGEDVTQAIRDPEVTHHVSAVSAVAAVRERLVEFQREVARGGGVVMDGRDIGSHVLPEADRKFFVTASLAERADRRRRELATAGHAVSPAELEAEIARRDHLDSTRAVSPLVRVPDAVLIDTTGLTVDEVVNRILEHCA